MLKSNTIAPLKVAGLFEEHLPVLAKDQEQYVAGLMAKEPPMSLEDFEDLLQDLDGQSEAVRLKCANTVRTGIYRYSVPKYRLHVSCTHVLLSKHCSSVVTALHCQHMLPNISVLQRGRVRS